MQHGALGGDAVARIGDVVIPARLLQRVAVVQQLAPLPTLDLLIDDALAAQGARAAGLDAAADVARAVLTARARLTALRLRDEAQTAGPPTAAEVDELTRVHWLEVDLPERRSVIHAVVLKPKEPSPALQDRAEAVASDLAASEAQARNSDDFESRAKTLTHPGVELKVERLEPFVSDGRVASAGGGMMDPEFARAAFQLSLAAATSGIVTTPFGWHVIRLIEILPERRVPFEDRRRWFKDEVEAARARRALDRLQEAAQRKYPVEMANGVDDLMTRATMAVLGVGRTSPEISPTP
jgi:hypothetical protein